MGISGYFGIGSCLTGVHHQLFRDVSLVVNRTSQGGGKRVAVAKFQVRILDTGGDRILIWRTRDIRTRLTAPFGRMSSRVRMTAYMVKIERRIFKIAYSSYR